MARRRSFEIGFGFLFSGILLSCVGTFFSSSRVPCPGGCVEIWHILLCFLSCFFTGRSLSAGLWLVDTPWRGREQCLSITSMERYHVVWGYWRAVMAGRGCRRMGMGGLILILWDLVLLWDWEALVAFSCEACVPAVCGMNTVSGLTRQLVCARQ